MYNAVACIDWLEVFCLEPVPLTEEYWQRCGFKTKMRDYGTPQYREVITLLYNRIPFVEIRRNPYSIKPEGGLFDPKACHVKLCNQFLYYSNGIQLFADFLKRYRFKIRALSRVDIAIDFKRFKDYEDPELFLRNVLAGKVHRRGRYQFRCFGTSGYCTQYINSISWGAARSMVGVKMYNKSLELEEQRHKSYIKDYWLNAGLVDQDSLDKTTVWRIEFSLRSCVKYFMKKSVYSKGELAIEGPEHELLYCNKKYNLGHIINIIRGSHSFYLKNDVSVYTDYSNVCHLASSLMHLYFSFAYVDTTVTKKYPRFADAVKVSFFELDDEVVVPVRNELVASIPMRLPQLLRTIKSIQNDPDVAMDVRFGANQVYDYLMKKYDIKDHFDLRVADRLIRNCQEQDIPFVVDECGAMYKERH